jgi:hypothetical protein
MNKLPLILAFYRKKSVSQYRSWFECLTTNGIA